MLQIVSEISQFKGINEDNPQIILKELIFKTLKKRSQKLL